MCSSIYDNGLYPIHEAVLEGNHEKILSLLNGGDNFNCLNDNNETPVHLAVILKDYDALKLLLSHCSQLAMEGYSSSLLLATSEADELSIQILLDYQCDPSYQEKLVENFWTPLHEACHKGLTSILEKFLNTNCDLNVRNEEGATPLYISCQYGQKQCLQMLLDHGANAEIPVFSGDTPLHIACQEGYYDCVASLLNKDVNINCHNNIYRTPLATACLNDQYECAKLLIENDASLYTSNFDHDSSPIHMASRHTNVLCLGLLIENGVDVNSVCMGCTPLYEAVSANNIPGCKLLLSKGADPNCVCENNFLRKTPLMAAACEDNAEIIKELVSHGADVNQTTFTSSLMLAAKFKSCGALTQLLIYNPDINFMDNQCNSALSTLCTVLVLNYSTDEYDNLLQCCRMILVSGGDITNVIRVSQKSPIMDCMFVRMCPDLIRLLLEFATSREHVLFLSKICEMNCGKELEDWEQLYDFIWQPRMLSHLCRIKIRCALGVKRLKKIEELPLPAVLKDYLCHSKEMTSD